MYKLISGISFLIRAWLCYNTIDNIPIFVNTIMIMYIIPRFTKYTKKYKIAPITGASPDL